MKIIVSKNYVSFDTNEKVNKKEYKATPLEFTFTEEYSGLTCKAVFSKVPKDKDEEITFYQQAIVDGKCFIPYEVLDGEVEGILIGVYGYEVDGSELVLRYSPEPKNLWLLEGSYYEGASEPEEITPSQFEQYTAYLNGKITELNRIKVETERLSDGVRISVTNSNGQTSVTEVYDGEKGDKGDKGDTGTTDYDDLINKPSINDVTLEGDLSLSDIGIGNVFTIKGSVATPQDLPLTGNSIGDVYYVESVQAGYVWIEIDETETWEELGEPIDLSAYQEKMQYTTLPTASSSNVGEIVQYTGTTGNDYINGYFYQCVENSGVYSWENVNVQKASAQVIEYIDTVANTTYTPKNMFSTFGLTANRWYCIKNGCYVSMMNYVNTPSIWCAPGTLINFFNGSVSRYTIFRAGGSDFFYQDIYCADYAYQKPTVDVICGRDYTPIPYSLRADSSTAYHSQKGYLPTDNTTYYIPTSDYNPCTKKYCDDSISSAIGSINTILATLTTPSNNGGGE